MNKNLEEPNMMSPQVANVKKYTLFRVYDLLIILIILGIIMLTFLFFVGYNSYGFIFYFWRGIVIVVGIFYGSVLISRKVISENNIIGRLIFVFFLGFLLSGTLWFCYGMYKNSLYQSKITPSQHPIILLERP